MSNPRDLTFKVWKMIKIESLIFSRGLFGKKLILVCRSRGVVGDKFVGDIDDRWWASIIRGELKHGHLEIALQTFKARWASPIPLVDYLVVIRDHEEVSRVRSHQTNEQAVLREIGVLEFVDANVAIDAADLLRYGCMRP